MVSTTHSLLLLALYSCLMVSISATCINHGIHGIKPIYQHFINHQDHFYTPSWSEVTGNGRTIITQGIAFKVLENKVSGTMPLHRYFSPRTGDHFYTTNTREIGTTHQGKTGKHGYRYEGHIGFVHSSAQLLTVPLHRYYNGRTGDHYYKLDEYLPPGYKYEGIQCYVYAPYVMHY